jgi:UrcA family protein
MFGAGFPRRGWTRKSTMYAKTLLTTVAFIACAGFAGGALAAPTASDPNTVSVSVAIGDLNLGDQAGAAAALHRIHNAARSICGEAPDARDLDRAAIYRDCMAAAIGPAVASLNNPTVNALYAGREPRATVVLAAGR